MAGILFVTGGDGFIGKALVSKLLATGTWKIRVLTRRPVEHAENSADGLTFVFGDLCDPATYHLSLEGVETVIHLAAVTGKAEPNEYMEANVQGTKKLLLACKEAGVGRFLYVSTIAATYPDQRYCPYAQSKARAEVLVRESGIPNTTIRPTVVIGLGSPTWRSFRSLARLPIVPLPTTGSLQLQPIDVDDVVQAIELVLSEDRFEGDALDLGGPDSISFADIMRFMHQAFYGKEPRFIHFPLSPVRALLAFIEPVFRPILPVTAGQLALFANDSTVSPNWLHDRLKGRMHTVESTIAMLIAEEAALDNRATREGSISIASCDVGAIRCECDVFSRYLVSRPPTDYVHEQYEMAVLARDLANEAEFAAFDRITLHLARRSVFFTRVADAYCAIFHRRGVLRRKLTLLLAILEHAPPSAALFDHPKIRGLIGIAINLLLLGTIFGLLLLLGIVLLLPSHLFCRGQAEGTSKGSSK